MLPLHSRGHLVGIYCLGGRDGPPALAGCDALWASHVAAAMSSTLERLFDHARLLRSGMTDPLTGWQSRRYLHARLCEEIARCQRHGTPATSVVVQGDLAQKSFSVWYLQNESVCGALLMARSAEEHGGPHEGWFWDPTRQGGGVLNDMGCHSIAVGWYALTPFGKPVTFLQPQEVTADIALLKWGQPGWREKLLKDRGVDYAKVPAEDFATGMVTFKNPETGQRVKAQFTNSWMFEKQGLRLFMDGMGPGYAFEVNTLASSLSIFIGDVAAEATANAEARVRVRVSMQIARWKKI